MSIDKQFHGDLEATSKGEMLAFMTSVKGSAGYVAMEQITGTLNGRSGTFVLQHTGTMTRGDQQLSVTVVPDSGMDDLKGLDRQDDHDHRQWQTLVRLRLRDRVTVTAHNSPNAIAP